MIGRDSPIRRFPVNLNPAQSYFLDGVRFAVETAESSYLRLLQTLQIVSLDPRTDSERHVVAIVHDAWFLVDVFDRLRSLTLNAPGFGKDWPSEVAEFIASTDHVRDLRNHLQHLDGRLHKLAKGVAPAWGTIGWTVWRGEGADVEGYSGSLVPGTARSETPKSIEMRSWVPTKVGDIVIMIEADGIRVRLDAVFERMTAFVRCLESLLEEQFRTHASAVPRSAPDLLMVLALNVDEMERPPVGMTRDKNPG